MGQDLEFVIGFEEIDESSEFLEGMLPHVLEVFGREGWNDPTMDIYNELDPRNET